ncbi:MAG: 50S ribosomal protein L5 [Desulfurococcaceae archaeon]|uniref:Large ribosomal subunit protein uL5 n=1 Tax=Staphylothermus marinus TaxID=2280 RepID=A0A7C4D766_STAMA
MTLSVEKINEYIAKWEKNPMSKPRIAKVTVNISVGAATDRLSGAMKVLEELTGQKPVPRKAKRTIKDFGIRKGENIAAITTLRKQKAIDFLKKVFSVLGNRLNASCFDNFGNFTIGIKEHIVFPGVKYDPEIGIFGMDIAVTIEKPGYRIIRRKRCRKKHIPLRHRVSREEAMVFINREFGVEIV